MDSQVKDLLLSCLNQQDLLAFQKVNRACYACAGGYQIRAHNIEHLLKRFFFDDSNRDLVNEFRLIQARTGTLISGSIALQFFDRTRYDDSDLDLYVEFQHIHPLISFIVEEAGYTFLPPDDAGRITLEEQLGIIAKRTEGNIPDDYDMPILMGVLTFMKGATKVQVMTSLSGVMHTILGFHSSICPHSLLSSTDCGNSCRS